MTDTSPASAPSPADEPGTVLEHAIVRLRADRITPQTLFWTLAASTLFLPSTADPGADGDDLRPLIYDRDGTPMFAAYTTPERAERTRSEAPYLLGALGSVTVVRMGEDAGLVINPGHAVGVEIPPEGLAAFRTELRGV